MCHYNDVTMDAIASQIISLTIVYSIVYSDADQRKHQSSASLAFERGINRGPVNSPHKWPVTRRMFPFDDVIMLIGDVWYGIAASHHNLWDWALGVSCSVAECLISLLWLIYWGREKMAAILQTTFSNAYSWMKMYEFLLSFPEVCS